MDNKEIKKEKISLVEKAKSLPVVFCVVVWALLTFYERDLMLRLDLQSLFLFDNLFFESSMNVPAGFLGYLGCFLTQFFYYPALGAAIFVLLLALVYLLTRKAFNIPCKWAFVAMVPMFLLLAADVQLGYWIYYIKYPGYWYVPTLGTIVALLAIWGFNKASYKWHLPIIFAWSIFGYPLFGFFALFSSLCMALIALSQAVRNGNRMRLIFDGVAPVVVALILAYEVPVFCYNYIYNSTAIDFMHLAGLPAYNWDIRATHYLQSIYPYWVPFVLLFLSQLLLSVFYNRLSAKEEASLRFNILRWSVVVALVVFLFFYWYKNTNYRIENKQDTAMWEEDWRKVADLARDTDEPSRQIVLNRNIALLHLGKAGEEMFTYPEGSADIDAPIAVHLTHTGGVMSYWCYGKFNFAYRWCVENAVERGWKVEYLKHAVRSMLLNGEYKLMKRYTNILKHTLFHSDWAERYERIADNPESIAKISEFAFPLQMRVYPDILDVDESFVEAYLLNNLSGGYTTAHTPLQAEAALMSSLIRKDKKTLWHNLSRYLYKRKLMRLPTHYQEAVLLYSNLDRSVNISNLPIEDGVRQRFNAFMRKTRDYKGLKETEMAPHFKEDFGDTYWYFYFFVRKIKTN